MTGPYLLDANVLIALAFPKHTHHLAARRWFSGTGGAFATCPVTQGALVRHSLRVGASAAAAVEGLVAVTATTGHEFWTDTVPYTRPGLLRGVVGHRQVTDAYLAGLARDHDGRLATFDQGLHALHPDVAELVTDHQ